MSGIAAEQSITVDGDDDDFVHIQPNAEAVVEDIVSLQDSTSSESFKDVSDTPVCDDNGIETTDEPLPSDAGNKDRVVSKGEDRTLEDNDNKGVVTSPSHADDIGNAIAAYYEKEDANDVE